MDQDRRSFKMSVYHGWQLQCTNTTCSPYMTITDLDIRRCQATCLAQLSCQGLCFSYLTSNCQLFANVWNQNNNLLTNTHTVTMFVVSGTRTPSEPTTTSTTSSSTTTTTTYITLVTGVQNYAIEVATNGYHGIQKFRYYSLTKYSGYLSIGYPVVYLSGTTFTGSYVNNAWYALHAGCGNSNGIASCTGLCKAFNQNYTNVTSDCGTGFPGSVTTYVNPDRAVYTPTDTSSTPWSDYGQASTCTNPMIYCACTTFA
ncbi:unnamed protein product [Adineta ricciae]|uniref:Apple domain-containing protein n=1 Tax=Adineta ricciae TaxID=249248 RepID=A0A814QB22_ADIRI|nr:unnamed protein product [Adineta ricciae]CAF1425066.1 unnamed protein product [Adineta ricciae]